MTRSTAMTRRRSTRYLPTLLTVAVGVVAVPARVGAQEGPSAHPDEPTSTPAPPEAAPPATTSPPPTTEPTPTTVPRSTSEPTTTTTATTAPTPTTAPV